MTSLLQWEVSLVDNINTDQIEQVIDTIEDKIKSVIYVKTSSKIYVEVEGTVVLLTLKRCTTTRGMMEAHKIITAHNV